jgi:hypothetical protein
VQCPAVFLQFECVFDVHGSATTISVSRAATHEARGIERRLRFDERLLSEIGPPCPRAVVRAVVLAPVFRPRIVIRLREKPSCLGSDGNAEILHLTKVDRRKRIRTCRARPNRAAAPANNAARGPARGA